MAGSFQLGGDAASQLNSLDVFLARIGRSEADSPGRPASPRRGLAGGSGLALARSPSPRARASAQEPMRASPEGPDSRETMAS